MFNFLSHHFTRFFFDKIVDDDFLPFIYVDILTDTFFLFEIFLNFFKGTVFKGSISNDFKKIAWKYVS